MGGIQSLNLSEYYLILWIVYAVHYSGLEGRILILVRVFSAGEFQERKLVRPHVIYSVICSQ